MKDAQSCTKRRGRPRNISLHSSEPGSPKKNQTKSKSTTNDAAWERMCINRGSSAARNINGVVSSVTGVSKTGYSSQRRVSIGNVPGFKEVRVVLKDIIHSDLISPQQRRQLINKVHKPEKPPLWSRQIQRPKKKSKASSVSSATTDSSVIFVSRTAPIIPKTEFELIVDLSKVKVESDKEVRGIKSCRDRNFPKKNAMKPSGRKLRSVQRITPRRCSNVSLVSTDEPDNTGNSVSAGHLGKNKKKESLRGIKRMRSETELNRSIPSVEILSKGSNRCNGEAAKLRERNCSDGRAKLAKVQNISDKNIDGFPKTSSQVTKKATALGTKPRSSNFTAKNVLKRFPAAPRREESPTTPNTTNTGPQRNSLDNGDLRIGIYRDTPLILLHNVAGSSVWSTRGTQANAQICQLGQAPPMPFCSTETEDAPDVDEKHCSLDAIAQAIENDLASGNRLSLSGECLENLPLSAPADAYCLRNTMLNGSAASNYLEILQQDKEKSGELSVGDLEAHEISFDASSLSSGRDSKRRQPSIVKDEIFPKGTVTLAPKFTPEKEKRRAPRTPIDAKSTVNVQNSAPSGNDAENSASGQRKVRLARIPRSPPSKLPEIAAVLQKNTACDRVGDEGEGMGVCEDALNNNEKVDIANKNFQKDEEKITLYPTVPAYSLDFVTEFNALSGLLSDPSGTGLGDPKPMVEAADSLKLDSSDLEIDEAIELFTASINSRSAHSRIAEVNEKRKSVESLTVQNVGKFGSIEGGGEGRAATGKNANLSRRQTFDTDSSVSWQLEDVSERSSGSGNQRKRRWVSSDNAKSSSDVKRKVKLNRGNWVNERFNASSVVDEGPAQPKNYRAKDGASVQSSIRNDVKIDNSQTVATKTAANNNFQKPSTPEKSVRPRDGKVDAPVPEFGARAVHTVAESKSAKGEEADETSDSSSSSSSSDSSSCSSSSSSSSQPNSSNGETPLGFGSTATKKPEKPCLSAAGIKPSSPVHPKTTKEVKKDKSQRGSENAGENESTAGRSVKSLAGAEKNAEDEEDCISLFTESLCVSRCGSPTFNEAPKCKSSPYKRMKYANIDNFVTANKRECNAVLEAYTEKVSNDGVNRDKVVKQKAAVELPPIEEPPPQSECTNNTQAHPTVQLDTRPDLRFMLQNHFSGQCFNWLKTGMCNNQICTYKHALKPKLQHIHLSNPQNIESVFMSAINNRYRYFIEIVHGNLVTNMPTAHVVWLYKLLYAHRLLSDLTAENTADILITRGHPMNDVVSILEGPTMPADLETSERLIRVLLRKLEPGTCWESLSSLISRITAPKWLIERVLMECTRERKSSELYADVYENLVKKIPAYVLSKISGDLLQAFETARLSVGQNDVVETRDSSQEVSRAVETERQRLVTAGWLDGIASPDPQEISENPSLTGRLPAAEMSVTAPASRPSVVKGNECNVVPWSSKQPSKSGSARSSEASQSSSYSMPPIDNLPTPKSLYADVLWKFHWDLQGVQEGLKHRDYTHVIGILTQYINHPSRLPHIHGFYNILCQEIMSSHHHLTEIVRLTVQSGASNALRQFVFDLGVYVLTKLADIGAWVLAYELLKTFQVYGPYNTCAYTLLAAEICIANYRPLKALALLKQSRLVFANTKVWNQMRSPNDEPHRATIMDLLLISLCNEHAQHALSLFEFILGDQCSNFSPINVSRHVDRIARALMLGQHTGSIIDLGRLIIKSRLSVSLSTFRSLINHIFPSDQFLARQLQRYAMWLGAYHTAKISHTTYMIISSDWTEEETYLVILSLISDLKDNIGHAIDRLRPRQLAVFLILETIPTEKQLYSNDSDEPTTNAMINKHKAIVRSVLGRFDPKIKLVQKNNGRLFKVQSASLVDYLKAGHFEH